MKSTTSQDPGRFLFPHNTLVKVDGEAFFLDRETVLVGRRDSINRTRYENLVEEVSQDFDARKPKRRWTDSITPSKVASFTVYCLAVGFFLGIVYAGWAQSVVPF